MSKDTPNIKKNIWIQTFLSVLVYLDWPSFDDVVGNEIFSQVKIRQSGKRKMAETSEMEDLVKNRSRQEDRRPLGDGVKFLTYEAKQKILKLAVGEMVSPLTLFFGAVLHKKRTIFVIQYFLFLSFFRPRFIMHVSYLLYYTKLTIELKCGTGCYIFL